MITCAEATRRLWEYLDATVDAATREAIDEHLARCRRCCGELEFSRQLRERVTAGAASRPIPPAVRDRIDELLANRDAATGEPS